MSKKLKNSDKPDKFKFLTEKSIRQDKFELTRWQSAQLRSKLPRGVYWVQIEKGGLIHWNATLLQSYLLLDSPDSPEHRSLVEEYIATLPQTS